MQGLNLTPFERSLMESLLPHTHAGLRPETGEGQLLSDVLESWGRHRDTLALRNQIDTFLGSAGRIDEIAALLLTILTEGRLFAYNRALLLLTDPDDGQIKGYAGIGTLSKEETWHLWTGILHENPVLEDLVERAVRNFREQNERLAPLLGRLAVFPGQEDPPARSFLARSAAVLKRGDEQDPGKWLFEALGTDQAGVIPMWGYYGHFGVLLVDNFASQREVCTDGVRVLESFVKPFVSALEKALIIDRFQEKIAQLEEASTLIAAQQEMLIRMERKNTVGRFTATLAHNLLNPILSMSGHIAKVEEHVGDGEHPAQHLQELRQALNNLEDFVADFISQVQEEFPHRHFWDLNHLTRETVSSYRRFHNVHDRCVAFEEGAIPLLKLDYERITSSLSSLIGIIVRLAGDPGRLTITTAREGAAVVLHLKAGSVFFRPQGTEETRIRAELIRLREFLAEEEVELVEGPDGFTMVFRI